jgi:hypothetical protein
MDDKIINTFVTNTNATILSSKNPTFTPLTFSEILQFISCIIFMGIVSMPTIEAHFMPEPFGGSRTFC